MKWFYSGLAAAWAAVGVFSWVRYLQRRRILWRERLNNAIPVNSQWWKEYQKREGELLYVAIGDSAAQGIGASKPGRSYVGELARHIHEVTGKTVRVANLGVSGSTVRGAFIDQLPKLRKMSPDVVTVSIGANNMVDFDAERFENDLDRLLNGLPPHAIVADLPSFYFLPAEKHVVAANVIVHKLAAKYGFPIVPLYSRTRRQGLWGVSTQFAGDLFHPNDRGYKLWASAFIPTLTTSLRERQRNSGTVGDITDSNEDDHSSGSTSNNPTGESGSETR